MAFPYQQPHAPGSPGEPEVRFCAPVSSEAGHLVESISTLLASHRAIAPVRAVLDLRGSVLSLEPDEARSIAELVARSGRGGRIALLVEGDLSFGVGRMIAGYVGPSTLVIRPYRLQRHAVEWVRAAA